MRAFPAVFALLCFLVPVTAQTNTDDVVKITTNLVQIDAVVTKKGKPVTDLKAEDFEIYEDGKLQTITSFVYVSNISNTTGATPETSSNDPKTPSDSSTPSEPNSPPPTPTETGRRRIALVIDDYALSAQSMADVRGQLRKFIDEQLSPNDLIAIIRTSNVTRELPNFTNDRNRINQAWEEVKWNHCNRIGVKQVKRVGDIATVGCGTGASFAESIGSLRAIVRALGQIPGRKSMVIFSDDMPLREDEKISRGDSVLQPTSESEEALSHSGRLRGLAELAIRSSVVIYGVDTSGLQPIGVTAADATPRPMMSGSSGNAIFAGQLRERLKLLQRRRDGAKMIAKATGGFLIYDQNEFQFDKILEDQSGYYLIGYRPSEETFNKKFRKLTARVKQPGLEVRTRSGFFGLSEEEVRRLNEKKK
ncbi:MAG TPA: VWA domain-containing protein [Pyrinomonadaceae bacterium]|nr:VWA domain-containing protein [Pyrinomonadaceae bacterium]